MPAIMPMCCTDNSYTDDAHYIGGALGHTNFQWGAMFKGVMAGPPDPENVGANWYITVVRSSARSTSMPGIQRALNTHGLSMLPSAVARTPAPSPGHTGHEGTRETGS